MRRGNFRDDTVDYAAVGATQAPDLMHYPPERSIPAEESWRIGSGEARFQGAGEALMSWTAQRGAGLTVKDVRPASGPMYSGVSFDAEDKNKKFAEKYGDQDAVTNFFFSDHSRSSARIRNLEREIALNYTSARAAR